MIAYDMQDTHGWVDLGLSVKWAKCNIGAAKPEDYGDYFAWGETTPKSSYYSDTSKTYGKHIGNIKCNPQYDAARANWGGTWRLPTWAECQELRDQCVWEWDSQGGHSGSRVTSKINGNSIFLPASGWRFGPLVCLIGRLSCYWGATPDPTDDHFACYFYSDSSRFGVGWYFRHYGYPIRPVCGSENQENE